MAHEKKINDGLIEFGGGAVRVERTAVHAVTDTGHAPPPEWVVYRRKDVSEDENTTYSYRYVEVKRFREEEEGVMPDAAREAAEQIAED
jgi:hypothetical protein